MNNIRALTISVDYHDLLSLTLPYNKDQFASITVVTVPEDHQTIEVAQSNGADVLLTEVFYEKNAIFNKFAAIERGLDYMGREGWICVMDADIAIPKIQSKDWKPKIGRLHCPHRLMHHAIPSVIPEERNWAQSKQDRGGFAGHCQIFHADDPALSGKRYWHPMNWTWAVNGYEHFERHWAPSNHVRPPFKVLHMGEPGQNWAGRATPFADGTIHEKSEFRKSVLQSMMNQRKVDLLTEYGK